MNDDEPGLQIDPQIALLTLALFLAAQLFGSLLLDLMPHTRIEDLA